MGSTSNQRLVVERAAWSFDVILSSPTLQLFRRIGKRQEPVGVQGPGLEAADDGLCQGFAGRLARPGEVQGDAWGIGPRVQVPGDELVCINEAFDSIVLDCSLTNARLQTLRTSIV